MSFVLSDELQKSTFLCYLPNKNQFHKTGSLREKKDIISSKTSVISSLFRSPKGALVKHGV